MSERHRLHALALALGLALCLVAAPSWSFSFGSFAPGDQIATIALSPSGSTPLVTFSTAGDQLDFFAHVTTINMESGAIFNINPGDVILSSTLMLVPGSAIFSPPINSSFVSGQFANGMTADLTITDVIGANVLLEGDYLAPLTWTANQILVGVVNGTLSGEFGVTGGDTAFTDAFLPHGTFNAFITAFQSNGTAVNTVCDLVLPNCFPPSDFDNWTANPNVTIAPIPEPGTLALVGIAVGWLAVRRRRS